MKNSENVTMLQSPKKVDRGFMFDEVQKHFNNYADWTPVGYAVMAAFEKTFNGLDAPAATVIQNRDAFVESIRCSLKECFGAKAADLRYTSFVEKVQQKLTPETQHIPTALAL